MSATEKRMPENYSDRLRANRAEAALRDAEDKLGRLLSMADAWSAPNFPARDAAVFAEAVRVVILP